jgi:hypothetical protein
MELCRGPLRDRRRPLQGGPECRALPENAAFSFFVGLWIGTLFILAIAIAHLYAWARPGLGPGPGTALKIGFLAGFFAGFPCNFAQATWSAVGRALPFGWMVEMWLGAIMAAFVAGVLYKE